MTAPAQRIAGLERDLAKMLMELSSIRASLEAGEQRGLCESGPHPSPFQSRKLTRANIRDMKKDEYAALVATYPLFRHVKAIYPRDPKPRQSLWAWIHLDLENEADIVETIRVHVEGL